MHKIRMLFAYKSVEWIEISVECKNKWKNKADWESAKIITWAILRIKAWEVRMHSFGIKLIGS